MKILDKNGKEMTREEVIASGGGHLLEDATYLRCSKCHRVGLGADYAKLCNMPQPDGKICDGRFN